MPKFYLLIALLGTAVTPITSAQPDPKETKDDLTMRTPPPADDPDKSITIHQEIDLNASPQKVYEALLDSKQFTEFSGRAAEINRDVGGAFSLIRRTHYRAKRGAGSKQKNRAGLAHRRLAGRGVFDRKVRVEGAGNGTHIVFDHIGFPEGLHEHLAQGWEENYWSLLKKYFH